MKHKIVILVSLVVVVALSIASIKAYHHRQYFINFQHRVSATAQKRVADHKAAQAKAELDRLKAQCAKDHVTFTALTPAQRKLPNAVTDCNPNLQLVQ